jgi:hypothetical protein
MRARSAEDAPPAGATQFPRPRCRIGATQRQGAAVASVRIPIAAPVSDRRFYSGMAVAIALTAFAGFAPTFYLRSAFTALPLSPLIALHGTLFTGWILLLLAQASLVAARRVDWHRRLGLAGVVLAAAMLPVGSLAAIDSARGGVAHGGLDPLAFMAVPFGSLALFVACFGAALWQRRRPELHKRLVLLATIAILTPAIARLGFVGQRPVIALALTSLFVLAGIAYDYASRRHVHPAYLWGGLAILASGPLRILIGRSGAWHALAAFLVG